MSEDSVASVRRQEGLRAVERGIRSLPTEAVRIVLARSALRAFPLLNHLSDGSASDNARLFISAYLHCVACVYGADQFQEDAAHGVAGRAASQLSDLAENIADEQARDAGGAAYYAVSDVGGRRTSDEEILRSLEYFRAALAHLRPTAKLDFERFVLEPCIIDIELAAGGENLLRYPIWKGRIPAWARKSWEEMKASLLARDEYWEVWTDWYDAILKGAYRAGDLERHRIQTKDEFRHMPPALQNLELWNRLDYDEKLSEKGDPTPVPGPYVVHWLDGKLQAQPSTSSPTEYGFAADMLDGLRELSVQLCEALVDNLADPSLLRAVEILKGDLAAAVEQIRLGRLQIDLRIMQGFAATYAQSTRESDLAVGGLLLGLSEALSDFTAQYAAVREMEAGRIALHVIAQEDVAPLLEPVRQIVEIAESSSVVGDSVVEALIEGDEEIEALTRRIADIRTTPADKSRAISVRSDIIGQKLLTIWNFGAEALRWSRAGLNSIAGAAGDGLRNGVRKGVEKGVEKALSATITGAAASLAVHLGQPMVAISLIVETFAPLAKRAKAENGIDSEGGDREH